MSNLGPQQQNTSYDGILQIPGGVTAQLQQVQDGEGRGTGLYLSSSGTNAATADSFAASINGVTIPNVVPRLISDGFGDYVSVKDFGATGDGTTDDTTAIQNALTAAGNMGGADVLFPVGNYKVTGTLTVPTLVRLVGFGKLEGGASTIHSSADPIFYAPSASGSYAFFDLRTISIIGARDFTQQFLDLPVGVSWAWSTVEGCFLVNIAYFNLLLTGVHFLNNNFQNLVQMELRGADCSFANNYIGWDDTSASTGSDDLIKVTSASAFSFVNNYVSSFPSTVGGSAPHPINFEGSSQINASCNLFDGGSSASVLFSGGSSQIVLTDNRITSITSGQPVYFSNVTQITFSNNYIGGLTSGQSFAGGNSTLTDVVLRDNQTNSRTDTSVHDYDASAWSNGNSVLVTAPWLLTTNISASTTLHPYISGRTITTNSFSGTPLVYIVSSEWTAGEFFYLSVPSGSGRVVLYDSTTGTQLFDSAATLVDVVKVASYTTGTLSVETVGQLEQLTTNTAATYSVTAWDKTIIQTTTASVYTLPAASSNSGRVLRIVTQYAGTVTSASSNVVPIAGGAAGTAILAATAGKWADLQSNGTAWVITASN